jgi:thioredoxin 1
VLQLRGGSNVKHPSSLGAFDDIVKDSGDKLVVVDFSAAWCMPCKMIAPVYDDMSEEECYEDVAFLKVDVDEAPAISERFKVMSMPTFIFLKNGKVVDRFSGASVEKLRETIAKLI